MTQFRPMRHIPETFSGTNRKEKLFVHCGGKPIRRRPGAFADFHLEGACLRMKAPERKAESTEMEIGKLSPDSCISTQIP